MKYMDFLCFPADVPFQLKKYSLVIFPMIPTLAMAFKKGWEAVQLQTVETLETLAHRNWGSMIYPSV
jgi:hypothetical protein